MADQFQPRTHNDVYPFIYPSKFKGSLKDKVTIITGVAGTIGQAHAEAFAVAGANLYLVYNRTAPPAELKEKCISLGATEVQYIKCDLSAVENCEKLVQEILDAAGKVDILVNNAGSNGLSAFDKQDPQDFLRDMSINFTGPYILIRLLSPVFKKQGNGCVINIASRAGTVSVPFMASYCASKAALIMFSACAQKEADAEGFKDIHYYSTHPGGVKSTMVMNKYSEESLAKAPELGDRYKGILQYYNDSAYLSAMVSVALATGIAKEALRGRYFDVTHDLEDTIEQTESFVEDGDLNALHTKFLGGFQNVGWGDKTSQDEPFEFPGY